MSRREWKMVGCWSDPVSVAVLYGAKLSEERACGACPPIGKKIQKWKQERILLHSGKL